MTRDSETHSLKNTRTHIHTHTCTNIHTHMRAHKRAADKTRQQSWTHLRPCIRPCSFILRPDSIFDNESSICCTYPCFWLTDKIFLKITDFCLNSIFRCFTPNVIDRESDLVLNEIRFWVTTDKSRKGRLSTTGELSLIHATSSLRTRVTRYFSSLALVVLSRNFIVAICIRTFGRPFPEDSSSDSFR